jgi:hypothetical protein
VPGLPCVVEEVFSVAHISFSLLGDIFESVDEMLVLTEQINPRQIDEFVTAPTENGLEHE